MKSNQFLTILTVAALLLVGSSLGFAGTVVANGVFGFNSVGGTVTYVGSGNLTTATSVSLPIPTLTGNPAGCGVSGAVCMEINTIPATYLAAANDFYTGGHTPETINDDVVFSTGYTLTISPTPSMPVFTFTVQDSPSDRFTFTATSVIEDVANSGNTSYLDLTYLGTFHDSGTTYVDAAASLSLAFTQTGGSTGPVNYSATFATPPQSGAPEPATMALLGSALVGLGLIGRKRFSR